MTTYSSFFASGLLAPPLMPNDHRHHSNSTTPTSSPALSAHSFPDALDDASDVDIEFNINLDQRERERSATPTPFSLATPTHAKTASQSSTTSTCTNASTSTSTGQQPRLRKRRSSLTVGASPMNIIKSPMRTASNALQLQRHLQHAHASPARSRSGSLSSVVTLEESEGDTDTPSSFGMMMNGVGIANVASERTSLMGRMRSGSVGTALKPRRPIRRIPAPNFPPPNAPLPPLPLNFPKSSHGSQAPLSPTHAKSFSVPPSQFTQRLTNLATLVVPPALPGSGIASAPALGSPRTPFGELQAGGYGDVLME